MDWFERLTGFRETDYDVTRERLEVDGCRLRSRVNGKSYAIGALELVPLQTLRERVRSGGGPPGRIKVRVVTGDVRRLHQLPEYAGALFQVASQFNLLEMVSPEVTPEQTDGAGIKDEWHVASPVVQPGGTPTPTTVGSHTHGRRRSESRTRTAQSGERAPQEPTWPQREPQSE